MPRKNAKHITIWPKGLNHEDQALLGIGHLVIAASTCEFFFFAILDCLIGREGERHCEVLWLSHRNTSNRINMVLRVCAINRLDRKLLEEVRRCATLMKSISELRNFYCHARYIRNHDGSVHLEGFDLKHDYENAPDEMVETKTKIIKRRSINELKAAVNRAEHLWVEMTLVAHRVRSHTGALHVVLPEPL